MRHAIQPLFARIAIAAAIARINYAQTRACNLFRSCCRLAGLCLICLSSCLAIAETNAERRGDLKTTFQRLGYEQIELRRTAEIICTFPESSMAADVACSWTRAGL